VDEKVIKQAFDEAAANAKTTAPTDIAKYIDNSFAAS
jgi:NitT/TauT family transport system substrate-binding protein